MQDIWGNIGVIHKCCQDKTSGDGLEIKFRAEQFEPTRVLAARATPWAWFPADDAITPLALCSGLNDAILLYAPLSLNENTWKKIPDNQAYMDILSGRPNAYNLISQCTSYRLVLKIIWLSQSHDIWYIWLTIMH